MRTLTRHYMDWSVNTIYFLALKEVHSLFLQSFLIEASKLKKGNKIQNIGNQTFLFQFQTIYVIYFLWNYNFFLKSCVFENWILEIFCIILFPRHNVRLLRPIQARHGGRGGRGDRQYRGRPVSDVRQGLDCQLPK